MLKVLDLARDAGYAIPPIAVMGIEPYNMEGGDRVVRVPGQRVPAYAAAAIEHLAGL